MNLAVRLLLLAVCIVMTSADILVGQSPQDKRWETFIGAHNGSVGLPEDEKMGVLADIRHPDPSWSVALEICEIVFDAIRVGDVPPDVFYEPVRLPLITAFTEILDAGSRRESHRYGIPIRNGNRITVPIRITGGEQVFYGYVYLLLIDENWFIDQWALDLSGLPIIEISDENLLTP